MTAATVSVNGHKFPEYKGGYTPFSFELTPHLNFGADNLLTVELDSTERNDIPPFGGKIDYLTFGGIYRDVQIRVVPQTFIENVYAKPVRPLENNRAVVVRCYLNGPVERPVKITAELRHGGTLLKEANITVSDGAPYHDIQLESLGAIQLWDLKNPKLYEIVVRSDWGDEYRTRIGFREAKFTPAGFRLNDGHIKLRGLNRHQTFPYMPARVQRRDAWILKHELHCNIVRTSHYPQILALCRRAANSSMSQLLSRSCRSIETLSTFLSHSLTEIAMATLSCRTSRNGRTEPCASVRAVCIPRSNGFLSRVSSKNSQQGPILNMMMSGAAIMR
jgi:beta-galactosidase